MPSTLPQVNFRVDADLHDAISSRSGNVAISQVARRDLDRYYTSLAYDLRGVALSEAEALLIADAANGTLWDAHSARLLWAEIEDALPAGLAAKWDVDGAALVIKLRQLTPGQSLAVVDAIERAWRHADHRDDLRAALRAVGLVR